MLTALQIALPFSLLGLGIVIIFNRLFRENERLPVRYSPGLGVIQTAPRRVALFALPVGMITFYFLYVLLKFCFHVQMHNDSNPSFNLTGIGAAFAGAETIYVLSIRRMLRKQASNRP